MKTGVFLTAFLLAGDSGLLPSAMPSFRCKVTSGSLTIIEDGKSRTVSDVLRGTFVYEHFKETRDTGRGTATLVVSGTSTQPSSTEVEWEMRMVGPLHLFERTALGNLEFDTIFITRNARRGQSVPYGVSMHNDMRVNGPKNLQYVGHYVGTCEVY